MPARRRRPRQRALIGGVLNDVKNWNGKTWWRPSAERAVPRRPVAGGTATGSTAPRARRSTPGPTPGPTADWPWPTG